MPIGIGTQIRRTLVNATTVTLCAGTSGNYTVPFGVKTVTLCMQGSCGTAGNAGKGGTAGKGGPAGTAGHAGKGGAGGPGGATGKGGPAGNKGLPGNGGPGGAKIGRAHV